MWPLAQSDLMLGRPNMRFVPVKNVEQQAALVLHCVRQGFIKARNAQANQIRDLLPVQLLIIIDHHSAKR